LKLIESSTVRSSSIYLPVGTAAGVLLAVEIGSKVGVLPVFVPPPSAVLREIIIKPRLLLDNLAPTTLTAVTGYVVAAVVALSAAGVASVIRILHGPIYKLGVILQSIPIIATAPLLALWLGSGPSMHVVIAALASQFAMLVGAMQGFQASDERERELFHILSARPLQRFRLLTFPSALPFLFAGFKIAAPSAVLGAVTAEWAGADRGVGAMMLYALFSYDITRVWLSVLAACLMAATGYALIASLERYVVFWHQEVELAD